MRCDFDRYTLDLVARAVVTGALRRRAAEADVGAS